MFRSTHPSSVNKVLAVTLACCAAAVSHADDAAPRRLPPVVLASYESAAEDGAEQTAAFTPAMPIDAATPVSFEEDARFEVGAQFDKGVFIRATDLERDPYSMFIGARLQLRHTGFARDDESFTDQTGTTREIRNRNNFDTERLRLNIRGTAIDPNLSYFLIFDGDSDGGSNVDQLAYFLTYQFDPAFKMRVGRWKVAAHREWLLSSRFLQMVDRSLATEFFRVGFSDGLWFLGDLDCGVHYEASVTNGARTSTRRPIDLDDNLGVALTTYWDALGPFGPGHVDYAWHESPVVRIGGSFVYDRGEGREGGGFPLGDNNFLRLTDGTLLGATGALAPGLTLQGDTIFEAAIDFGLKYRGWSVSSEVFFRSLQQLEGDGPVPFNSIEDNGFRFEVGKFLIPQRVDVNGRMSQVGGLFGDAFEYSLAVNYYWGNHRKDGKLDDRINKWSFDVGEIKGSPVTSGPADFVAGDDGVLFRTQVQWGF